MTDDALCADPAISGSASAGQDGTAGGPAHERRRLTAESFKALTQRLKNAGETSLFPESSTISAASLSPRAESLADVPVLRGVNGEEAPPSDTFLAVNGKQTAAEAADDITLPPFETALDEAAVSEDVEQSEQALLSALDDALADSTADEASEVPEAAPFGGLDDEIDEPTIGETVAAPEENSLPEPAEAPEEPTVEETDEAAAASEEAEFDRALKALADNQAPDAGEEMLSPEPGERAGELVAGETDDPLEQIISAVFASADDEPEDAAARSSHEDTSTDIAVEVHGQAEAEAEAEAAGSDEPDSPEPTDLSTPTFTEELEEAVSAEKSEAGDTIGLQAAGGEDEALEDAEPAVGAGDDGGDDDADDLLLVEPETDHESEDAVAAQSSVKDASTGIVAEEHEDVTVEAAESSEPDLQELAELPPPTFTDELEAALTAEDSEAGGTVDLEAAGGEDEAREDAELAVSAADDSADEDADDLLPAEPETDHECEDAVAVQPPDEDASADVVVDEHRDAAAEAAEPSEPDPQELAELPPPTFTDELEAALPAEVGETASTVDLDAAGSEDETPPEALEEAEPSSAAADDAGDEDEATAGSSEEGKPGELDASALQDMLRQLEGRLGSLDHPAGDEADVEATSAAAGAASELTPPAVEAAASPGASGEDTSAEEVSAEASEESERSGEDEDAPLAAIVPDEASGETARMLLDIMSMPSGSLQPQERSLAADTLLRLIARMPAKSVLALAERVCLMDEPPGLIVKQLIGHPNEEVAALVLEKCANVTDQDLLDLIAQAGESKRLMVARRRYLSSALVDALIDGGDVSVYLTIVRNPGADISYDAFIELCELAKTQPSLQAPLATRANTPAPVAFELFWFLPSELRRYVLSRFLTDSETLSKILKITLAVDASAANDVTERKFPPRARIEELVGLIEEGLTPEASRLMANLSGICEASARRLIADPDGEPLTVVMKAMGATRALFAAAVERWQTSTSAMLHADRNLDELRNLFDSMSFNKARVLLTYWDWAARRAGPYARHAA